MMKKVAVFVALLYATAAGIVSALESRHDITLLAIIAATLLNMWVEEDR